jgi:excisionase family DNA binding protein
VSEVSHLLTVEEMGRFFQVSTRTIHRWIENDLIPTYRVGKTVRFDLIEVFRSLKGTVPVDVELMGSPR